MNRVQKRNNEKEIKKLEKKLDKKSISEIDSMIKFFQKYLKERKGKNNAK